MKKEEYLLELDLAKRDQKKKKKTHIEKLWLKQIWELISLSGKCIDYACAEEII